MFVEYTWLVPLLPMICFVAVGLIGKRTPEGGAYLAIAGAAASCVISVLVAYEFFTSAAYHDPGYVTAEIEWFKIPGGFTLHFGYYIDSLACLMMLFASFISTLIFVYSKGYMHEQGAKKRRYYAEVSLFLTGMLGLAVSSNFLEMFVFWEIMGLCSYLLIGFWSFSHPEGDDAADNAASAAKKAFLVTRLGDVCLMAGLFVVLYSFGSLDYVRVFDAAAIHAVDQDMLVLGSLLIFGGVIGKSAQFPLLDWLPDAMAGPTTVSALIHAATMVKAGVYLVARCYPLFAQASEVMLFVGIIGGVTAFFAATMALNNMNIKRVLAYSTLSQLGYMFLALGAGGYLIALGIETGDHHLIAAGAAGYVAGCLHMANHAFFKALLFLCSGSVIHAVGTEDMRKMGGLHRKMKITSVTMLIGSLSIAGFPFFSGFWSKELVLETVMHASDYGAEGYLFTILWLLAVVTAFMTAFYMFRMWFMTFSGKPGHASEHCHGESPASMTAPLAILSAFAIGFGFTILFGFDALLSIGVEGPHHQFTVGAGEAKGFEYLSDIFGSAYTYLTIALVLGAIGIAHLMYNKRSVDAGRFNGGGESFVYKALTKRWWFPQLYDQISWKLGYGVARGVDFIDRQVVDGTVNGLSNAVAGGGELIGKAQTGDVRSYTWAVVAGVVLLFALMLALFYFIGGGI
ncbi:MAG: NADH-quinone oxidoreductase subunit L [Candidatus Methanoplasma sp.]|jgi:NADH-quinone oxidoreductase subunit L|nr:NADH-quinone oxidoreductase subunit L [Candidatus Methanoplasma sp.]